MQLRARQLNTAASYEVLGDAYMSVRKFAEAETAYREALKRQADVFDVQVRLESFNNSPYASSVTQVGAQLGTDRITFGTGRSDIFWVL